LGDNVLMPLRTSPKTVEWNNSRKIRNQIETLRSGNSLDVLDADWLDPDLAGLSDETAVRDWWFELVQAMGVDDLLFRDSLTARFDPEDSPELAQAIVQLRPKIFARLQERGLDTAFYRFDPYLFNPAIPLGGNLLFAVPTRRITQETLVSEGQFIRFLREQGLAEEGLDIAQAVIDILHRTFGRDGTDHPLFRQLDIDPETYERLVDFMQRRRNPEAIALTADEEALLMTVPFTLTAEQIGPAFPDTFKDKIVSLRRSGGSVLRERTKGMFMQVRPSIYIPRLTLLENAIYGRVSLMAGAKLEQIEDTVAEILTEEGLNKAAAAIVYNTETGIGGSRLNTSFQERVAFSRAAIKRPDVLILDGALASQDGVSRTRTRNKLRELLPKSTMIFMESEFANPGNYDLFVELKDGRVDGVARASEVDTSDDFLRKLSVISRTDLFSGLDRRNQRLLAFSASWYDAAKGDKIFERGQRADAAYLCLKGKAELRFPTGGEETVVVSEIDPGRLIGDLSIIADQDRQLDLVAMEESTFLRIGADEYKAVIQSDGDVAMNLLKTVSGYLIGAADTIRDISKELPEHKIKDVTRNFEQQALTDDTDQDTP
jgi:putative ABC transport system ATP-binding protein